MPKYAGESRGCECGSVIVVASGDRAQTTAIMAQWSRIHPDGERFHGRYHRWCGVPRARAIRKAQRLEAEVTSTLIAPERRLDG